MALPNETPQPAPPEALSTEDKFQLERKILKAEIGLVTLDTANMDPAIEAALNAHADKISSAIDTVFKSHDLNADKQIDFAKLYYREVFYRLANQANAQLSKVTDSNEKLYIKEAFAKEAQSTFNLAITQINNTIRNNGGYIDSAAKIAKFCEESLNFSRLMRDKNQPEMRLLLEYTLKPPNSDADERATETQNALATIENLIIEHYSSGHNPKTPKAMLFFLLSGLSKNDRATLFHNLKENIENNLDTDFDTNKFLEEGNAVGAITLQNMEEFQDSKYTPDERKKFNNRFLVARENLPGITEIRGNFGDANIWNGINSKTIGLFFADTLAATSLALNSGFAIGSGNTMDILKNDWNKLTGGWLIARHLANSDEPIGKTFASKEEKQSHEHQKARRSLLGLSQNTLAFEEWNNFLSHENSATRLKDLNEFANKLILEHGKLPAEVQWHTLETFFQQKAQTDPSYNDAIELFKNNESAIDPKAIGKLLYAVRHFKFDTQSGDAEGIVDFDHYQEALDIIDQEK